FWTDFEPVLDEDDARVDHGLLDRRRLLQESLNLIGCGVAHHALYTRTVVPTAIEDHDFTGSRKVADVALHIHLRLLALSRRRQRDDAKHSRAHALGNRLDRAALARGVSSFEHDAHLGPCRFYPLLHRDKFAMQAAEVALILLVLHALDAVVVAVVVACLMLLLVLLLGHGGTSRSRLDVEPLSDPCGLSGQNADDR